MLLAGRVRLAWAPVLWTVGVATLASLAGVFAAVLGTMLDVHAFAFLGAGVVLIGALVALKSIGDQERLLVTLMLVGIPAMGYVLPPRRFGVTLLDAVMAVGWVIIFWRRIWSLSPTGSTQPIFVTWVIPISMALLLPSVMFSMFPSVSVFALLTLWVLYLPFLLLVWELRRPDGADRVLRLLIAGTLLLAAGLFVERATGLNIALGSVNPNQMNLADGELFRRARGFFGDPQKAAQFFACAATFLGVLLVRRRFAHLPKTRIWAVLAVLASLGAVVVTVSRGSIAAAVIVLSVASLLFNRWSPLLKVAVVVLAITLVLIGSQLSSSAWAAILPNWVVSRFDAVDVSARFRFKVWFDTWEMFADHPFQGIGLGSFRPYMEAAARSTRNYQGIGTAASSAYIPDQPESGYFKILYEGGLMGSLAYMLVVGATVARFVRVVRSPHVGDARKSEAIAAMAALVVFAITFVTLFTLTERRLMILVCLLVACVWATPVDRHASRRTARFHEDSNALRDRWRA